MRHYLVYYKVVLLHVKKAYGGSGGIAPRILKFDIIWRLVVSFRSQPLYTYTRGKSSLCPFYKRLSWGPVAVWNMWKRERSLAPASKRVASLRLSNTQPRHYTNYATYYVCIALLYCVCIAVFTVDAGLLARSQYSEGPATGHLDTGFSWFLCVYKQMLRWFPRFQVATTCLSCSPPDLNLVVTNFMFCLHVK